MRKLSKAKALELCQMAWGKNAAIEDMSAARAGTPESRAEASEQLKKLRGGKKEWPGLQNTVAFPDTMSLGEYRKALKDFNAAAAVWRAMESDAVSRAMRMRYKVGTVMGGFAFHIKGSGDTWEEALTKAGVLQPDGTPYSWAHWNRPAECTCIKHTEKRIARDKVNA